MIYTIYMYMYYPQRRKPPLEPSRCRNCFLQRNRTLPEKNVKTAWEMLHNDRIVEGWHCFKDIYGWLPSTQNFHEDKRSVLYLVM